MSSHILDGAIALALAAPALPQSLTELVQLVAQDPSIQDHFGHASSIDGDTVLVGADLDDEEGAQAGAAFVYYLGPLGSADQVAKLTASDAEQDDLFGQSVSLSGDTALVGARRNHLGPSLEDAGAAYVFQRDWGGPDAWGEVARLVAGNAAAGDEFGESVSISGDVAVVGAMLKNNFKGAAYVFERDEGGPDAWGQVTLLTASNGGGGDFFGVSVAVSGDTIAVGATGGGATGAVYVYEPDGAGGWDEVAIVQVNNGFLSDHFGEDVALFGDTLLVGAPYDHHTPGAAGFDGEGSAYVFLRDLGGPGAWGTFARLSASDAELGDRFGHAVAVSADTALVCAPEDDHAPGVPGGSSGEGAAYLFVGAGGGWTQLAKLTAGDALGGDEFGSSCGLSSNKAVVGAQRDDIPAFVEAGSAYVFSSAGAPYCTAGTSASGCQALLSATGAASATAPQGYDLLAAGVEGAKDGLFFFGTNGRQANPWGNGSSFQCVTPPVTRLGILAGSGSLGQCDGSFAQDLNALWCPTCPAPQKNPGAGVLVQAQLWYRDPQSTSNQTTSLSNATEFLVVP